MHINYHIAIAIIIHWTCPILPNLCEFAHFTS